jgi:hypothetical protein
MNEIEQAHATIASFSRRDVGNGNVKGMLGDQAGICEVCHAVAYNLADHRDWHCRSDGKHYEQGVGR